MTRIMNKCKNDVMNFYMICTDKTIWWMDVRYNFVYILITIFDGTFLSGKSNLISYLMLSDVTS